MFKFKYIISAFVFTIVLTGTSLYFFKDQASQYIPLSRLTSCIPGVNSSVLVEVYSLPNCPYCRYAKALLDQKGVEVTVLDLGANPDLRKNFLERTGGKTSVPQIFINGKHVGDYGSLKALDRKGELDCQLNLKCTGSKSC